MVRMQIVVAGGAIRQAVAIDVGLPDRVGAPQTLLRRLGVEAVGLGQVSLAVGLCQQTGVAVQEVRGCACSSASRSLADPSPKRVIPIAGGLPVLARLDQPLCRVVAVVSLLGVWAAEHSEQAPNATSGL